MADELIIANMSDALVSETRAAAFEVKAHETGTFLDHAVIRAGYLGNLTGSSSNVISKSVIGLGGYDPLSSTSEGVAPSNTALGLDTVSVTVTKHSKVYAENSDIVKSMLAGRLGVADFVRDAFAAYQASLMDSICAELDGLGTPVGSASAQLDAPTMIAAFTAARVAKLGGPYMAILHDYQWGQLSMDLGLTAGGALQWIPATAELMALRTGAYLGNWLGVDIYASGRVVEGDSGTSRIGAILGTFETLGGGAGGSSVVWADADFVDAPLPTQVNLAGKVLFGLDRGEREGETSYVSHAMFGTGPGQVGVPLKSINSAPA